MAERRGFSWVLAVWLLGGLVCLIARGPVLAQPSVNELRVDSHDVQIGLGGYVQPGRWGSLRVRLTNPTTQPLPVICQWQVVDGDGERVFYERAVTLNEQRTETIWLYAALPVMTDVSSEWRLRILNEQSRDVLTSVQMPIPEAAITSRHVRLVGVTGSPGMWLQPYALPPDTRKGARTQQEGTVFLTSLRPAELPDRWHGMDAMSALIWTPAGGDPGDPNISPATLRAIREWVRRGGHLVVVLPAAGDLWTTSPLGDMLPSEGMATLTDVSPPAWVGPAPYEGVRIDVKRLQPRADATVIATDEMSNPLILGRHFGFGRVTMIGVDLTHPALIRANLPSGKYPIWNSIFGWQGPAFREALVQSYLRDSLMPPIHARRQRELDTTFIPDTIAMRGTAAIPLLLAIVVFGIYWLLAGPASFGVLKARGLTRFSWLVFIAVVGIFSVISWGGAWLLRPVRPEIEHFTFLDFNADGGPVRARSWLSVLVPTHGPVELVVGPDEEQTNHNFITMPGMVPSLDDIGFPDSLSYTVSANAPYRVRAPFRSTAKQFDISYLGEHLAGGWTRPGGNVTADAWPQGTLTHDLPGVLRDVRIVFNRGDGTVPWFWSVADEWRPGEVLELEPPRAASRLFIRPQADEDEWAGALADLMRRDNVTGRQRIVNYAAMLTLYDQLPPPRYLYREAGSFIMTVQDSPVAHERSIARPVDMSPLTLLPSMTIIGVMDQTPLPVPFVVDGQELPSNGWTVVRWYHPLSQSTPTVTGPTRQTLHERTAWHPSRQP